MSEKQSGISTRPQRESIPTLLLDENLSSQTIAEFLRRIKREWVIELCTDHLPRGTPDPDVIKLCAERNWVLISCDDNIRYVPENKSAVIKNRVRAFFFGKGNYQGVEYGAALIVARHQIVKAIQGADGYLLARVTAGGDVSILEPQVAKATTSRGKTEQKYGKIFEKTVDNKE